MVSETEFDKFQAAQLAQITGDPEGVAAAIEMFLQKNPNHPFRGQLQNMQKAIRDPAGFGGDVALAAGAVAGGAGIAGALTGGGAAAAAGGIGGGKGALGVAGAKVGGAVTNKLLYLLSGVTMLNSLVAAFSSVPNSIIGKEVNKWAAENPRGQYRYRMPIC